MRYVFKKYQRYKESGVQFIGLIPSHWEVWKATHGYGTIGSGATPKSDKEEYYNGDIPWITTSELREKLIDDTNQKLTELALEETPSLKIYKPGAVAIAMYGATIGRLGILGIKSTVNQACCVFDSPKEFVPKFLFYWLWMYRDKLIAFSVGGGQPNLSQDDLKQLRIPIPRPDEQSLIANFLDKKTSQIDKLIAEKEKLLRLLAEKRTAIITRAVTKGLDRDVEMKESGVDWLGKIPKHWTAKKMKFVSNIANSTVDKKSIEGQKSVRLCNYIDVYYNDIITEDIPFMEATASAEEIKKFSLEPGDLIITKDSESPDDIGIPSLVVDGIDNLVCGYHLSMIRPCKNRIKSEFLFYFFKSILVACYFETFAQGVTRFGLSLNVIKSITIPIPPVNEQILIIKYLEKTSRSIDRGIMLFKQSINQLKEYRESLITTAVTGQIDLRKEGSDA